MKANLKVTKKQVLTLELNNKEIHTLQTALGIMLYEECNLMELFGHNPALLDQLLNVGSSMFNKIERLVDAE